MERWGENVENCRPVSRVNRFRFIKGRSRAMIFELSSNIPCMARNHGRRGVCHYAVCNRFRVATKFIEEFLCGASLSLSLSTWRGRRENWIGLWFSRIPFSPCIDIFPNDRKDARQGSLIIEWIDRSPAFLSLSPSLFARMQRFEHVYEPLLFRDSKCSIFQSESE